MLTNEAQKKLDDDNMPTKKIVPKKIEKPQTLKQRMAEHAKELSKKTFAEKQLIGFRELNRWFMLFGSLLFEITFVLGFTFLIAGQLNPAYQNASGITLLTLLNSIVIGIFLCIIGAYINFSGRFPIFNALNSLKGLLYRLVWLVISFGLIIIVIPLLFTLINPATINISVIVTLTLPVLIIIIIPGILFSDLIRFFIYLAQHDKYEELLKFMGI